MSTRRTIKVRENQQGFVAIFLLVMLAVSAMTALTTSLWGHSASANLVEQQITQNALRQAKDALLSYIETNNSATLDNLINESGNRLPCPDNTGNNGVATIPCGAANVNRLGLLPWSTLGIPKLLDGSGACLWYIVSGNAKALPVSTPLNAEAVGQLSIIQASTASPSTTTLLAGGDVPSNRVMAVVIAPGIALGNQNRTPLDTNKDNSCPLPAATAIASASAYLDIFSTWNNNTSTPTAFANSTVVQADTNQALLNDQLIWITADEFAQRATQRTARILQRGLAQFAAANAGAYPPPASTPGGVCNPALTKGFVPLNCPALVPVCPFAVAAPALNMGRRLNQHEGAQPACVRQWVANVDQWLNQTHYAVGPGLTVDGTATTALLLLRGRTRPAQLCAAVIALPDTSTTQAQVATCLETNAVAVTGAGLAYTTPDKATSNDLLIRLP